MNKKAVLAMVLFFFTVFLSPLGHADRSYDPSEDINISRYLNQKAPSQILNLEFNEFLYNEERIKVDQESALSKWIWLDFWATWCVPCVASLPRLNAIQEKEQSHLHLIAVGFTGGLNDKHPMKLLPTFQQKVGSETEMVLATLEPTSPQLDWIERDRTRLDRFIGVPVLPYAILIDPQGIIKFIGDGKILLEKVEKGEITFD